MPCDIVEAAEHLNGQPDDSDRCTLIGYIQRDGGTLSP